MTCINSSYTIYNGLNYTIFWLNWNRMYTLHETKVMKSRQLALYIKNITTLMVEWQVRQGKQKGIKYQEANKKSSIGNRTIVQ